MLLDDGRMAFFDFGLFKRMPPGAVELEIQVARAMIEGDTDTIMRLGTEIGLLPRAREVQPRSGCSRTSAPRPRGTRSTSDDRADARVRDPGADRHERSAVRVLRPAAPRVGAARPHLRPADGGADAGRAVAAARARQLPPDRARVVLRRPAGDRARRARRPSSTAAPRPRTTRCRTRAPAAPCRRRSGT